MSLPKQHKVLHLLAQGGPFAVQTVDTPHPGPDDVLLRLEAIGLNPFDWKVRDLGLFTTTYPVTLGEDGAGVVAAVGSNVNRLKVGDRVTVEGHFVESTRTYQQYVATPAAFVAKIPDFMSFDEAVTLPVSVTTAVAALYNANEASKRSVHLTPPWEEDGLGKYAGKAAVVFGGSSAVGQAVLQFLALSGFSPIVATASSRNTEFVKSFGATHVVDRTLPPPLLAQTIRELAGGSVELVFDAVSMEETKEAGYDILTPGGSIILVLPENFGNHKPSSKSRNDIRVVEALGDFVLPENWEFGTKFTLAFEKLLQDGDLKPGISEVLEGGFNAVQEGLNRIKAEMVSGRKLVVHPQEDVVRTPPITSAADADVSSAAEPRDEQQAADSEAVAESDGEDTDAGPSTPSAPHAAAPDPDLPTPRRSVTPHDVRTETEAVPEPPRKETSTCGHAAPAPQVVRTKRKKNCDDDEPKVQKKAKTSA